jgi:fructose-1-phosphate kinase PfkB-like protein
MKSFDIVTLTVSPALEKALISQDWFLNKKFVVKRLCLMQEEGINVSKAISRLEGKSLA